MRRTALVAIVGFLVLADRASAQISDGRDWNAWPWMHAHIPPPVQLSARVVLLDSARDFQGILIFQNAGRDSVTVSFGSCSFGLRLYGDSSLHAPPLWDNRLAPNVDCTLELRRLMLAPGERREHVVWFTRSVIAGAPPAGRYTATITWRPSASEPVRNVAAGNVVIRD